MNKFFPRPGPRFGPFLPGTPTYTRHKRRCFWLVSWDREIRHTNDKMKPRGKNDRIYSAKVHKTSKW